MQKLRGSARRPVVFFSLSAQLEKLHCDESIVGEYVLIDGQRFHVVGLIEEKGSFAGESLDDLVLIPHTVGLKMYPYLKDFVLILEDLAGSVQGDRR